MRSTNNLLPCSKRLSYVYVFKVNESPEQGKQHYDHAIISLILTQDVLQTIKYKYLVLKSVERQLQPPFSAPAAEPRCSLRALSEDLPLDRC